MPNPPTKWAGGRAEGASRGGPRGGAPPGKPCATQWDVERSESIDGTEDGGDRSDRTEYLPAQG
eukprot:15437918-Alexandrium_andersonii.AAC.1